jgi:hypothetical protein
MQLCSYRFFVIAQLSARNRYARQRGTTLSRFGFRWKRYYREPVTSFCLAAVRFTQTSAAVSQFQFAWKPSCRLPIQSRAKPARNTWLESAHIAPNALAQSRAIIERLMSADDSLPHVSIYRLTTVIMSSNCDGKFLNEFALSWMNFILNLIYI